MSLLFPVSVHWNRQNCVVFFLSRFCLTFFSILLSAYFSDIDANRFLAFLFHVRTDTMLLFLCKCGSYTKYLECFSLNSHVHQNVTQFVRRCHSSFCIRWSLKQSSMLLPTIFSRQVNCQTFKIDSSPRLTLCKFTVIEYTGFVFSQYDCKLKTNAGSVDDRYQALFISFLFAEELYIVGIQNN